MYINFVCGIQLITVTERGNLYMEGIHFVCVIYTT